VRVCFGVAGRRREAAPGQAGGVLGHEDVAALGAVVSDRELLGAHVVFPPHVQVAVEAAAQDLLPVVGVGACVQAGGVQGGQVARAVGPHGSAARGVAGPAAVVLRAVLQLVGQARAGKHGGRARGNVGQRAVVCQHVRHGTAPHVPCGEIDRLEQRAALEHVRQVRVLNEPAAQARRVLQIRAVLEHAREIPHARNVPTRKRIERLDVRAALEHVGHVDAGARVPQQHGLQVVVAQRLATLEHATEVLRGARVPAHVTQRVQLLAAGEHPGHVRRLRHVHAAAVEREQLVVVLEPAGGVVHDDAALGAHVLHAVLCGLERRRRGGCVAGGLHVAERRDPRKIGRCHFDARIGGARAQDQLGIGLHILPPRGAVQAEAATQEGIVPNVGDGARMRCRARVARRQAARAVEPRLAAALAHTPHAVGGLAIRKVVIHAGTIEHGLLARDNRGQQIASGKGRGGFTAAPSGEANHVGQVGSSRCVHIPFGEVKLGQLAITIEHVREVLNGMRVPASDAGVVHERTAIGEHAAHIRHVAHIPVAHERDVSQRVAVFEHAVGVGHLARLPTNDASEARKLAISGEHPGSVLNPRDIKAIAVERGEVHVTGEPNELDVVEIRCGAVVVAKAIKLKHEVVLLLGCNRESGASITNVRSVVRKIDITHAIATRTASRSGEVGCVVQLERNVGIARICGNLVIDIHGINAGC